MTPRAEAPMTAPADARTPVPYQESHVGPCVICGRELLGREAGLLAGVVYCLPSSIYDAGAYSHTEAACADEAERRAKVAMKRGMRSLL